MEGTKKPFKHNHSAAGQRQYKFLWGRFKKQISTPEGWYAFKKEVKAGKHGQDVAGMWDVFKDMRRGVMNRRCTATTNKRGKKRFKDTEEELRATKKRLKETEEELKRVREELEELKDDMPLSKVYPHAVFGKKAVLFVD